MKIKDAIDKLLNDETVVRFTAEELRDIQMAMAYNVIDGRHVILVHSVRGNILIVKEADMFKTALEEALLERHTITTGVTRTGNGFNTGYTLEWRVINRSNIFILPAHERERVKAWLSRIPQPAAAKPKQIGLREQAS